MPGNGQTFRSIVDLVGCRHAPNRQSNCTYGTRGIHAHRRQHPADRIMC